MVYMIYYCMNKNVNHIKMLRVLIALCHVDKKLDQREVKWINKTIKRFSFSQDQINNLNFEIHNPSKEFINIFKSIDDYSVRIKTMDLARHAFGLDENLCQNEKNVFQLLTSIHNELSNNTSSTQQEAAKSLIQGHKDKLFYRELEILGKTLTDKNTKTWHFFFRLEWIIHKLLFGNWMTRLILLGFLAIIFVLAVYKFNFI